MLRARPTPAWVPQGGQGPNESGVSIEQDPLFPSKQGQADLKGQNGTVWKRCFSALRHRSGRWNQGKKGFQGRQREGQTGGLRGSDGFLRRQTQTRKPRTLIQNNTSTLCSLQRYSQWSRYGRSPSAQRYMSG